MLEQCEKFAVSMAGRWPDPSTRISSTQYYDAAQEVSVPMFGSPPLQVVVPAHCEVRGQLRERAGALGQQYAIRFHLRLPTVWNHRFYFQGGGGTNGDLGNALGMFAPGVPAAISQGFVVVSQDSGHDNGTNTDPSRGGTTAFGFDSQARADYGHASLQSVSKAAKAAIATYYRDDARFSYFVGCSKGGAEGMAVAQKYPGEFDGVLASAPGFSLPRAALAQAWDVRQLSRVTSLESPASLARAFSDDDLALAARAILAACDDNDGLRDGIVGAFERCEQKVVHRKLSSMRCRGDKSVGCLSAAQIVALERVYAGPADTHGRKLYADWPWDAGIASPAWRFWKLGSPDGTLPALNITLGGSALAAIFTVPPTVVPDNPAAELAFLRDFDFDRDAQKIYSTDTQFPRSAWDDISARSSDLSRFKARHGKLLVPHGVSDAVFSLNDTLAWYREVDQREDGRAADFVRVFPVPGMGHCGGGPATDRYDAFASLMKWVEEGVAPDRIVAEAGAATPWPGRQRPLCPYPKFARYTGTGSSELAESFACK